MGFLLNDPLRAKLSVGAEDVVGTVVEGTGERRVGSRPARTGRSAPVIRIPFRTARMTPRAQRHAASGVLSQSHVVLGVVQQLLAGRVNRREIAGRSGILIFVTVKTEIQRFARRRIIGWRNGRNGRDVRQVQHIRRITRSRMGWLLVLVAVGWFQFWFLAGRTLGSVLSVDQTQAVERPVPVIWKRKIHLGSQALLKGGTRMELVNAFQHAAPTLIIFPFIHYEVIQFNQIRISIT